MHDNYPDGSKKPETNEIVTQLSHEERLVLEVIQGLLEPCDRKTYGERQRQAAAKLGKSVRTIRRLVKKWEEQGLAGIGIKYPVRQTNNSV